MKLKAIRGTLTYENEDVDLISSFKQKGYRTTPALYVNGSKVPDHLASQARADQTLLSFLREVMLLTGTKLGCSEGGCGACTVTISKYDTEKKEIIHYSANACLMPVLATDGCHVTTVEGVGSVKGGNLHPIQKAMVDMHGSQCGKCLYATYDMASISMRITSLKNLLCNRFLYSRNYCCNVFLVCK